MQSPKRFSLCLIAISLTSFAAFATPQNIDELAGNYTLSGIFDGDPYCNVLLSDEKSIGGWALSLDENCSNGFSFSEQAYAWFVDEHTGEIVFIDAERNPLMRYRKTGEGDYVTGSEGQYPNLVLRFESAVYAD